MATANTPRRVVGHPRKLPCPSPVTRDQHVTVEAPHQSNMATYAECSGERGTATAMLSIPNHLLYYWRSQVNGGSGWSYIDYVNNHIIGEFLRIDRTSERLESALYHRASSLNNKVQQAWGSPQRNTILEQTTKIYLLDGESLSYTDLHQQLDVAVRDARELQEANTELQASIDRLYIDMNNF